MADTRSHKPTAGGGPLPELRIVLLGNKTADKTSAGNIILGRAAFDPNLRTLQCVKRQGEVAGRQVTVVDTPGWTDHDLYHQNDSSNFIKQEIVLSVMLCPPGPHAVLLVIHEDMKFKGEEREATLNHLHLLGNHALKHSLVLFIRETPTEEEILVGDGNIESLVERCDKRYHVLDIKNKDDLQVQVLLEKIEEIVLENNGHHYEVESKTILENEKKRMSANKRAEQRKGQKQKNRTWSRSWSMKGFKFHSEVRAVLLGCKGSGKSSSGNTILGKEEFQPGQRSAVCVKRQGEVAGTKVTLVEAPGWYSYKASRSSSEMIRKEIVLSQSLCDESPHCILIVIRAGAAFTSRQEMSMHQHVSLLGEGVWSHTIVLFTHGDWLVDTSIEQHIECETHLKSLIERCSNRYHVLNNYSKDQVQVSELLKKIVEITAGNSSENWQMDKKKIQEVSDWKRQMEDRAEKRLQKVKSRYQGLSSGLKQLPSMGMVLLGTKFHGRTSAGNTILGEHKFDMIRTAECMRRQGDVAGRQVTVVDVPGWWRNINFNESAEIIKQEIEFSVTLCPPGPHAVLLVLCVDLCFTEEDRKIAEEHMEVLGDKVWNHAMMLFTNGDWLGDTPVEQYIESEGEHLQWLVERCGNRYHIFDNEHWGDGTQVTELLKKIEVMVAENGGCTFEVDEKWARDMEEKRNHACKRVEDFMVKVNKQDQMFKMFIGKSMEMHSLSQR
ncbi:GTPase IMAP family member 8-like [Engraulis encrasicolus]|uniref:GTPase IMAP family member 8-like n=1 Tax=Engraulis encrasicolus TaxID=184585 RepID=UPI002FD0F333